MRMDDPVPTFSHFVTKLSELYSDMAYIHVVEPRVLGSSDDPDALPHETLDFLRNIWKPRPFISAGGYRSAEEMVEVAESKGDIIAMGRYFISNVSSASDRRRCRQYG